MVRYRLSKAVERVEGVRGVWSRHNPLVMWLMERLIKARVVQASVDQIDEEVGEEDEDRKLEVVVEVKGRLGRHVVQFGVASHFGCEAGSGQDRHARHGSHCLLDLHPDLVLEIFRMFECVMVENKIVRGSREEEVEHQPEDPCDEKQTGELSVDVVSGQCTGVSPLGWFEIYKPRSRLVDVLLCRSDCPTLAHAREGRGCCAFDILADERGGGGGEDCGIQPVK